MLENEIAAQLGGRLGTALKLAVADREVELEQLSDGERTRLAGLGGEGRAASWRVGRAALKRLRARLGEDADTSAIRFPSRRYSLSHSGGYAVAVAAERADLAGIGIDLEFVRPVDLRAGRFFLTPAERVWVEGLPEARRSTELLRLWTIKEALFKADPGNVRTGLSDYALGDPASARGALALRREKMLQFRYVSLALGSAVLAVAEARERSGHDQ